MENEKRTARNEEDKTVRVDKMSYEEWKERFVEEEVESDNSFNIPDIRNPKISKAYEDFGTILNRSKGVPKHIRRMKLYKDNTEYKQNDNLGTAFAYNIDKDIIEYNPNAEFFEDYDLNYVQAHELTHRMDMLSYKSWKNESFAKSIEKAKKEVYNNKEYFIDKFKKGGEYENEYALSDIISGLTKGEFNEHLPIGHKKGYWNNETNVIVELFADISAIDVLENISKNEFNNMFKEMYEAYKEIVK